MLGGGLGGVGWFGERVPDFYIGADDFPFFLISYPAVFTLSYNFYGLTLTGL